MKKWAKRIETAILIAILIIFEIGLFVFQSSFDFSVSFPFIVLKLLPLFSVTFVITLLLIRFFKRKRATLAIVLLSALITITSLFFSITKVSPYFENFTFKGPPAPITIKINSTFEKRLIVSSLEFLRLFPLLKTDRDVLNHLSKVFRESFIIFELKNDFQPGLIKRTCSDYKNSLFPFGDCVTSIHQAALSQINVTATGNILLTSVAALGVFTTKDFIRITTEKQKRVLFLKLYNDIIEIALSSCKKAKETITTPAQGLPEFIDQELEFEHLRVAYKKFLSVSILSEKEAKTLSQKGELARVRRLKSAMKELKLESIFAMKESPERNQLGRDLKGPSLFYFFSNGLTEKLYSKLFSYINNDSSEKSIQDI